MHVFLRTASLLLATTIAVGCSNDHDADNGADAFVPPPTPATGLVAANLLSDQAGVASHQDPALVNAWGLAMDTQSFWISNNGSGKILVIAADGSPSKFSPAAPALDVEAGISGMVANTTGGFMIGSSTNMAPAQMIVVSESGKIFALNPTVAASPQKVVDRSSAGAVYKGVAIVNGANGPRLLAADFHNNRIDVFDTSFNLLANVVIVDPSPRAGMAPFNLYVAGSTLYIAYAVQDAAAHDDQPGVGNGRIDAFDLNGNFLRTLVDGGTLNAPWGMAIAPAAFNAGLSGSLIVGNFGDGTLMSVDPTTGANHQLNTPGGVPLKIDGLWGLMFGSGQVGQASTLYFTAGPAMESHGLYGSIVFGTAPPT